MTLEQIFEQIQNELRTQDMEHSIADHYHTPADWVAITTRHLGLAIDDEAKIGDYERYKRQMIRVASIAINAVLHIPEQDATAGLESKGNPW